MMMMLILILLEEDSHCFLWCTKRHFQYFILNPINLSRKSASIPQGMHAKFEILGTVYLRTQKAALGIGGLICIWTHHLLQPEVQVNKKLFTECISYLLLLCTNISTLTILNKYWVLWSINDDQKNKIIHYHVGIVVNNRYSFINTMFFIYYK